MKFKNLRNNFIPKTKSSMATKTLVALVSTVLFVSCAVLQTTISVQANDSIQESFFLDHQALPPASTPTDSHLTGTEARIGGLDAYVSGSRSSHRAVLLASDVFGYKVENLRKIADKAAASGFFAVVPDFFNGDPYDGNRSHLAEWKRIHDPSKSARRARVVVEKLKRHLRVKSIGAAGFCFGAKVATELAKAGGVKAIVLLHPTDINSTDIANVQKPIAILLGGRDGSTNASTIEEYERILKAKQSVVPSFVKIYPGAAHGWTTRYNSSDAGAVELADEAHRDLLNWFRKYVK